MKRIVFLFTFFLCMMNLSCRNTRQSSENPLLEAWETPYGVPPFDRIRPEHFRPAFEEAMARHEAEIEAITANPEAPTFENTLLAYDEAGRLLEQTALLFGMLSAAETNEALQRVEAEVMPMLTVHSDRIGMNEALFARIRNLYDRRSELGLDAEQLRLLQKTYDGFVRAGALLDAINGVLADMTVEDYEEMMNEAISVQPLADAEE